MARVVNSTIVAVNLRPQRILPVLTGIQDPLNYKTRFFVCIQPSFFIELWKLLSYKTRSCIPVNTGSYLKY
jgi:hypothetical protein